MHAHSTCAQMHITSSVQHPKGLNCSKIHSQGITVDFKTLLKVIHIPLRSSRLFSITKV